MTTAKQEWRHKDMWSMRGKDFMVQVSRHGEPMPESMRSYCYDEEGEHRWCVYAYIYPKHPHFAKFKGDQMWQEAATCLPLHAGPSYLRYHYDEDRKVTSVQVGADYNHLHDTHFTRYETREQAAEVFQDADDLFEMLAAKALGEESQS